MCQEPLYSIGEQRTEPMEIRTAGFGGSVHTVLLQVKGSTGRNNERCAQTVALAVHSHLLT